MVLEKKIAIIKNIIYIILALFTIQSCVRKDIIPFNTSVIPFFKSISSETGWYKTSSFVTIDSFTKYKENNSLLLKSENHSPENVNAIYYLNLSEIEGGSHNFWYKKL